MTCGKLVASLAGSPQNSKHAEQSTQLNKLKHIIGCPYGEKQTYSIAQLRLARHSSRKGHWQTGQEAGLQVDQQEHPEQDPA